MRRRVDWRDRQTVKRIIRFDGGASWGEWHFWQSGESIARDFREGYPLPVRNIRVEDKDGRVLYSEGERV